MMRSTLIVANILAGVLLLGYLMRQLGVRAQEVSDIRGLAVQEHADTVRIKEATTLQQNLLTGVRTRDPYVVELLARERLGYVRPNEFAPPPLARNKTP